MNRLYFFRTWDIFILILLLGFPVYWFHAQPRFTASQPIAYVEIAGHLKYQFPLDHEEQFYLREWNPPVVLEIRPGKIRILQNDCPKQICVHTGFIDKPYQTIVCVPKKIVIYIKNGTNHQNREAPHAITG